MPVHVLHSVTFSTLFVPFHFCTLPCHHQCAILLYHCMQCCFHTFYTTHMPVLHHILCIVLFHSIPFHTPLYYILLFYVAHSILFTCHSPPLRAAVNDVTHAAIITVHRSPRLISCTHHTTHTCSYFVLPCHTHVVNWFPSATTHSVPCLFYTCSIPPFTITRHLHMVCILPYHMCTHLPCTCTLYSTTIYSTFLFTHALYLYLHFAFTYHHLFYIPFYHFCSHLHLFFIVFHSAILPFWSFTVRTATYLHAICSTTACTFYLVFLRDRCPFYCSSFTCHYLMMFPWSSRCPAVCHSISFNSATIPLHSCLLCSHYHSVLTFTVLATLFSHVPILSVSYVVATPGLLCLACCAFTCRCSAFICYSPLTYLPFRSLHSSLTLLPFALPTITPFFVATYHFLRHAPVHTAYTVSALLPYRLVAPLFCICRIVSFTAATPTFMHYLFCSAAFGLPCICCHSSAVTYVLRSVAQTTSCFRHACYSHQLHVATAPLRCCCRWCVFLVAFATRPRSTAFCDCLLTDYAIQISCLICVFRSVYSFVIRCGLFSPKLAPLYSTCLCPHHLFPHVIHLTFVSCPHFPTIPPDPGHTCLHLPGCAHILLLFLYLSYCYRTPLRVRDGLTPFRGCWFWLVRFAFATPSRQYLPLVDSPYTVPATAAAATVVARV